MVEIKPKEIKVHKEHREFIRDLYKERFTILEIYEMYEGFITYGQIRNFVKGVERKPKI